MKKLSFTIFLCLIISLIPAAHADNGPSPEVMQRDAAKFAYCSGLWGVVGEMLGNTPEGNTLKMQSAVAIMKSQELAMRSGSEIEDTYRFVEEHYHKSFNTFKERAEKEGDSEEFCCFEKESKDCSFEEEFIAGYIQEMQADAQAEQERVAHIKHEWGSKKPAENPKKERLLEYAIYEIASGNLIGNGIRKYSANDIIHNPYKGKKGEAIIEKYVELEQGYKVGARIFEEKELDGFGLVALLNEGDFSWEWFDEIEDGLFEKRQDGQSKVRIRTSGSPDYEILEEVAFLDDTTFDFSLGGAGEPRSHLIYIREGSVLRFD